MRISVPTYRVRYTKIGENAPITRFTIVRQPVNVQTINGLTAGFSCSAISSNISEPNYQWELSTDNGITYIGIPGQTNTTYSFKLQSADFNDYKYRCKIFGANAITAFTNPATLFVQEAQMTIYRLAI